MTRNGILRTSPNVWCLKLAILFKLKTGERLGRVGFTVLTGPALYVEVGQIRRWKHSEPECEISGTASYRYSWSFTSIYHGLVLCQSQYHYLYPTMAGHWGWLQMVEDWNTFKLTSISTEIRPDLICIFWFVGTYGDGGGGRGMFSSNCHQNQIPISRTLWLSTSTSSLLSPEVTELIIEKKL